MVVAAWLKNDGIVLNDDGRVVLCEDCPCGDEACACEGVPVPDSLQVEFALANGAGNEDLSVGITRQTIADFFGEGMPFRGWYGSVKLDGPSYLHVWMVCDAGSSNYTVTHGCSHSEEPEESVFSDGNSFSWTPDSEGACCDPFCYTAKVMLHLPCGDSVTGGEYNVKVSSGVDGGPEVPCPCGVCCGGDKVIGDELWATFEADDPCLDGKKIKLNRVSANNWRGTNHEDGGGQLDVWLSCTTEHGPRLNLTCNLSSNVDIWFKEDESSCEPLEWVFENEETWFGTWWNLGCDCAGLGPLHVKATITK